MSNFEEIVNGAFAIQHAEKIKEYCKSFKSCDKCAFYIGTCQLQFRPFDWDLKNVRWNDDK